MGRLMLARNASTTRRLGKVVALQTTVSLIVRSETTMFRDGISTIRLDFPPGSIDSNMFSSSATRELPLSNPHDCWKPRRLEISTFRNLVKFVASMISSTRLGDLVRAYKEASMAPADVPQYSFIFVNIPRCSSSSKPCKKTRQRVPPPQNTMRFAIC